MRRRRGAGFSLVELLVATAIFTVLGGTLVLMLRQGVAAWRTGESRRAAYEQAQAVLGQLRDDLRNVCAAARAAPGQPVPVRFLCDLDARGRQRLAFVRTVPAETRHPIASLAGTHLGGDADWDGEDDQAEAFGGRLRPTGGLLEVLYAMDPEEDVLLRAARAPIGGEASFFREENLDDPAALRRLGRPLASGVLHLELAFWTQHTESWTGDAPLLTPVPGRTSGPTPFWDSTRAILPAAAAVPEEFQFWRGERSILDPSDDVFPERVLATLVLEEEGPAAVFTALAAPLAPKGLEARVFGTRGFAERRPYARIGGEWVRFEVGGPDLLKIQKDGRGRRGTAAQAHETGTPVVTGRTFQIEIDVPAFQESWNE